MNVITADKGVFDVKKKALIISLSVTAAVIAVVIVFSLLVPFGMCGRTAFWFLGGSTLKVTGHGDLNSYSAGNVPWNEHIERIRKVSVGKDITSVGENIFASHPALENVYISEGVEEISPSAFSECTALLSFEVDENNTSYCSDESGVLFNKEKSVLILYPMAKADTAYTIPDGVSVISVSAFSGASALEEITFPESIDDIENHAFSFCNGLETVYLPDGTQSLGIQSFYSCSSLKRIIIPGSIKSISTAAFSVCESLSEINFVGTKDRWDALLVEGNNNWSIVPTVTFISDYGACGENAEFIFTRDRELIIRGTGNIDDFSWSDFSKRILSVTVCDGIEGIGAHAFSSLTRAETVTVPESVKTIGDSAFYGFTSEQTVSIDNTEAFAKENFAPAFNNGCEAEIIYKQ